jgi:4-hydroxy-2-oxoheptanedioate aldolase
LLVGTVISSPDLVLAERIGQAFDFAWIDLEHSALTIRDAQQLAIAIKAGGGASLVRLPRSDTELIGAILDTGVDGIVGPRIESEAEARDLVQAARHPPAGSRGFAPRRSNQGLAAPPEDVACVVQIESARALARLDAIAETDGVDGLVVGTSDLSFDLGSPLDVSSEALESAVRETSEAASRHEKAWGVAIGDLPQWGHRLRTGGANMLVFSSDARIYADAIDHCVGRLRDPAGLGTSLAEGERES